MNYIISTSAVFMVVVTLASNHFLNAQMIVAHRGASADAPENTIAAFRLAWKQGADAIEGDFCLSEDGKIVCIHDKDTARTAGVELIVDRTRFSDLRRLDVGSWMHRSFAGEKIPTLAEVLAIVPKDKKIFIEIKCGPEVVSTLKKELEACALRPDQVSVISFKSSVIAETKKQIASIKAYWLTGFEENEETGVWEPTIDEVLTTLKQTSADGLDTEAHELINAEFVKRLRDAQMEFHCWTVDEPEVARRFHRLGVDSITTNRPAMIRKSLAKTAKEISPNDK